MYNILVQYNLKCVLFVVVWCL